MDAPTIDDTILDSEQLFTQICEEGLEARNSRDNQSWRLGDLANRATRIKGTVKEFADFIGTPERTTQGWANVSHFFPKDTRHLYPTTSYTHYKYAAQFGGDLAGALALLDQADANYMTCQEFYRHCQLEKGKPIVVTRKELKELLAEACPFIPDSQTDLISRIEAVLHG